MKNTGKHLALILGSAILGRLGVGAEGLIGHTETSPLPPTETETPLRHTLTYPEAKELFLNLKPDLILRMCHPEALCYNRSQILGHELEHKHGIASQKLYLYCPGSIEAFNRKNGGYHRYSDHWTNVVSVQNSAQEPLQRYVLDPQFKEDPILLEDYLKSIVQNRKPIEVTEGDFIPYEPHPKHFCYYRLVDRRYSLSSRYEVRDEDNVKWNESELTKLRTEIQNWNVKMCPKTPPLSPRTLPLKEKGSKLKKNL